MNEKILAIVMALCEEQSKVEILLNENKEKCNLSPDEVAALHSLQNDLEYLFSNLNRLNLDL